MSEQTFLIVYAVYVGLLLCGCAYAEYLGQKARDFSNTPEAREQDRKYEAMMRELRDLANERTP